MKGNGWKGNAIDVDRMPDGKITTIDNTRVLVVRYAEIDVKANVHAYDDALPSGFIERFTTLKALYKLLELELTNFDVWYFMDEDSASQKLKGLKGRYPNRILIPFARRGDCDDIACFE